MECLIMYKDIRNSSYYSDIKYTKIKVVLLYK